MLLKKIQHTQRLPSRLIYVSFPKSIDLLCILLLLFCPLKFIVVSHTSIHFSPHQPPPSAPKRRSLTPGMTLSSCFTILLLHFLPINKKGPWLPTCERCVTSIKEDLKRTTKRPIRVNSTVKMVMRNENHSLKRNSYRRKKEKSINVSQLNINHN